MDSGHKLDLTFLFNSVIPFHLLLRADTHFSATLINTGTAISGDLDFIQNRTGNNG